jgi:hypothetical protein
MRSKRTFAMGLVCSFSLVVGTGGPAWAQSATVSCGLDPGTAMYTSINAALDDGQTDIQVRGSCEESVIVWGRDSITIEAAEGATAEIKPNSGHALLVVNSGLLLRNIAIKGGSGVQIDKGSFVEIDGCTVEDSAYIGVQVLTNSNLILTSSAIKSDGEFGITVADNSMARIYGKSPDEPVTIEGNASDGIYLDSALAFVQGNTIIRENGHCGFRANGRSRAWLIGGLAASFGPENETIVEGNRRAGVSFCEGSQISIAGPVTIRDNGPVGVRIAVGSQLSITGSWHSTPAVISGHSEVGVDVSSDSHAFFLDATEGGPARIVGNGPFGESGGAGVRITGGSNLVALGPHEVVGNSGPGISADFNSTVQVAGAIIANNTAGGVTVKRMSLADLRGDNTYTNNGAASVSCDKFSMVVLSDKKAVPDMDCSTVDVATGVLESPF